MKNAFLVSAALLLLGCAQQSNSTPLPDDKYALAMTCAITLSSAATALGQQGKIREQLPYVAATMNAENARNRLGKTARKTESEITADQQKIFADLKTRSAENPKLLTGFENQCLAAFEVKD